MKLSDRSLETELAAIAERAESGRTAQLAIRRWGWDGRGGATLEATGREIGDITRERVRQLCERLAKTLDGATATVPAPALDRALVLAAHIAPTTAKELARRLADEQIAARPFEPAGLLRAAAVLGRDATFSLNRIKHVCVVLPDPPDPSEDTEAMITSIIDTARALVRRSGAARVGDVTGRVAADLAVWVDDTLVTAIVSEPEDFVWLERRTGWFYLSSVAKNAVVSRVRKILSITGAARLADLHAGIRRDERMKEFVMPEYILAELCERLDGVSVAGDVVRGDGVPPPEEVLERTELALLHAFRQAGGEAERRELALACRKMGMKAASFANRIAYSPMIRDLGQGRYGLRGLPVEMDHGAPVPHSTRSHDETPRPGDLEHFHPPRRR